jgi:hypothetical protein
VCRLGIPYRAQEEPYYCAAACVQMWIEYDLKRGLPAQRESQDYLCQWMGCNANPSDPGAHPDNIKAAVNFFTASGCPAKLAGHDPKKEGAIPQWKSERLLAQQIASVDDLTPMLVAVNDGRHLVILEGGNWHRGPTYGVWDTVIFHDPDPLRGRKNWEVDPTTWVNLTCPPGWYWICYQVYQEFSILNWELNIDNYGEDVRLRGTNKWNGHQQQHQ